MKRWRLVYGVVVCTLVASSIGFAVTTDVHPAAVALGLLVAAGLGIVLYRPAAYAGVLVVIGVGTILVIGYLSLIDAVSAWLGVITLLIGLGSIGRGVQSYRSASTVD
jgi:hypothetical protein